MLNISHSREFSRHSGFLSLKAKLLTCGCDALCCRGQLNSRELAKIITAKLLSAVIADSWMEYMEAKNTHNVPQSLHSEMLFIS